MKSIQLIKHEDIDKVKWNSCIHYSTNGNIFGYWWYLRNTAKEWDALVEIEPETGYYESVMPLFSKEVKGSHTLYVPDMVREAGIYSIHLMSKARIAAFLEAIPAAYDEVHISLNTGTTPPALPAYSHTAIDNHALLLNEDYETIAAQFLPALTKGFDQSLDDGLLPNSNIKPEKLADFYKKFSPSLANTEERFHSYQRIMYNAMHRSWGFISGIENTQKELIACCFFVTSHGRVSCLMPAASPEGVEKNALALLLEFFIRSQAGRPVLLDFNSPMSDWPEGLPDAFGAKVYTIYQLEKNS